MNRLFLFILLLLSIKGFAQFATMPQYDQGVFGSENFIRNSGAEANDLFVTDANSIHSRSTSSPLQGKASHLIDAATNGHLIKFTTKAIDAMTAGNTCEASFYLSGDGSLYKTAVFLSTTNLTGAYLQLENVATGSRKVQMFFPCGASGDQPDIEIQATSNSAAAIKVDGVYLGKCLDCTSSQPVTNWVAYTPTIGTGFGTPVTNTARWRRVGDSVEVQGYINPGTFTANPLSISLPSGLAIDTTKVTLGNTTSNAGEKIGQWNSNQNGPHGTIVTATGTSTTLVYFSVAQNAATATNLKPALSSTSDTLAGTNTPVSYYFTVPISGWGTISSVRLDQTNIPWTSYTPASTQGFGTISSGEFYWRRVGQEMQVRGRFTAGTVAASEARISLPTGFTSASAGNGIDTTLNIVGKMTAAGAIAYSINTLIEPGVTYFTFGKESTAGLTKANGDAIVASSGDVSFYGSAPISGWTETQNAPMLVGSVTSGTTGTERIERAKYFTTAWGTICSGTPCGSSSSNSGFTVTRSSAGTYTAVFTAGMFSAAPSCVVTAYSAVAPPVPIVQSTQSATAWNFTTQNSTTGALFDTYGEIICMGPR